MRKQILFYCYKFNSTRIKNAKNNIIIDIKQARENGEVITVGKNQVIKSLLKLKGIEFEDSKIKELFLAKKMAKKELNNHLKISSIENEIDNILFIKELISIHMDNKRDYKKINNSLLVNGKRYVRLLCGASHARRNTVIFVQQEYEKELKSILNNGAMNNPIVLAKRNAYFALSYSGAITVSNPYFCVVPDCEIKRKELVDFVDDNYNIITEEKELDFNLFDGQGIISPRLMQQWSEELELDYMPSTLIIRNSYLKGMVACIDFHKYSDEIGKHIIKDVWGNEVNIRDMDLIITASQFKCWNSYKSCQDYIDNCNKNNFSWGITRVSPKNDINHANTNYQFLQTLNITKDKEVESICQKTVDYFKKVTTEDTNYTLLYLLGKMLDKDNIDANNIFEDIRDNISKAIILNNKLISDPYIKKYLYHSINKKIKDSYIGNLIVDGNYSFMVSDPYALMEHIFSEPVVGLLERDTHYSNYWNKKDISKVSAMRAPLTWRSEVNTLNLKNSEEIEGWYKYLNTGCIVINIHGNDTMLFSDGDFDGDIIMTTNQKEFIDNSFGGLPITYDKKKAEKKLVVESELWETDILSFDSKIGFITNLSTTMYSMLPLFDKDSKEYSELINRLKLCRVYQGNEIDKSKGIEVKSLPKHWYNWSKVKDTDGDTTKKINIFNNSIMIDKRPYFFRYLYTNYNKDYNNYIAKYENFCNTTFGKELKEILSNPSDEQEETIKSKFYHFNLLLDTDCLMNKICHHMEKNIKELKENIAKKATEENILILKNPDIPLDSQKYKLLYALYQKYKSMTRKSTNPTFFETSSEKEGTVQYNFEQCQKIIRREAYSISSNIQELANIAVTICYEAHPSDSKSFAWDVFGEGIIENIKMNRQEKLFVPVLDENGPIEFLGRKYSKQEIYIEGEEYSYETSV